MPTATKSKAVRLTERVDAIDGRVDRSSRIIRGVSLCGLESKNGYRYRPRALRDALPKYEGRSVFLDHRTEDPQGRSVRDLAGVIRNPRIEGDRLRGDIHVLDVEAGRTLLAIAETQVSDFGMSHVCEAIRNDDGSEVEEICDVMSVDAVFRPATTGGMFESQAKDDDMLSTPRSGTISANSDGKPGPGAGGLRDRLMAILDDPNLDDAAKLDQIRAELGSDDQDASSADYEEAYRDLFGDRRRERSFVEYLKS